MNGEGEADGLVLTDGTEVHFPPHMGQAVLAAVRQGAAVRVRGVRPRGATMLAAVSAAPEEGDWIVDAGLPAHDEVRKAHCKQAHAARAAMQVQGIVRQLLHGPKGEVRGVLLEDGRAGRFPPHAAASVTALLAPGRPVLLRGDGFAISTGTVIVVRGIGTSAEDVRVLEHEKPHRKTHADKHGKEHRARPHDPLTGDQQASHPI